MRDEAETRSWQPSPPASERTTSINVPRVPLMLRRRFAAKCKLAGVPMQRRLQELIEQDVADYWDGNDAGR